MQKVQINTLDEMFLHIDLEIKKRNIPVKQQKRMSTLIKKMAADSFKLGQSGSVEVELSDT